MRAAITRKPAPSNRRYTSPIKLRPTPSGFTIERVRSIGMMTSGAVAGNPPQWGPTKTAKCTGEGPSRQSGRVPKSLYYLEKPDPGCRRNAMRFDPAKLLGACAPRPTGIALRCPCCAQARGGLPWPPKSDVEALAAAAFALGLGVLELERLIQTLLDEVHQRSIDQRQAGPVDHHLYAARFEHRVLRANFVGIIHHVRKSGTPGLLDADPQADARAPLLQMRTDPISRRFRQQYCHTKPPLVHRKQSRLYITCMPPRCTEPEPTFLHELMPMLKDMG